MKKMPMIALLGLSSISLAFNLILFGGFSYANPTGWALGLGVNQGSFESDIFVTYSGSNTAFNVIANLPFFTNPYFKTGPSVLYMYSNYTGNWTSTASLGAIIEHSTNDYSIKGGLYYPINASFNFSQNIYLEFRYILQPSGGRKFKDKLFFFLTYSHGFFRFGAALSEPIP